jgi:hypothetical protein
VLHVEEACNGSFCGQVALITSMLGSPAAASACAASCSSSSAGAGPADVTVATVDSYQGLEKPVIILSTAVTRAGAFVADPHRLNVALTRAKNHLILVRWCILILWWELAYATSRWVTHCMVHVHPVMNICPRSPQVGHGPVLCETAPAFRALMKAGQPPQPVQSWF